MTPLSHADAVRLSGGDPWLRFAVDPATPLPLRHDPAAGLIVVARRRPHARDADLVLLPAPGADPGVALAAARPLLGEARSLTLPRAFVDTAASHFGLAPTAGAAWDWMWTGTAPSPVPAETEVVDLRDAAGALPAPACDELRHLLTRHSPRHSVGPDSPAAAGWVGVRRDGSLVACAAWLEPAPGIPLLASVAVHPDARRAGLGAALVAAVTRRSLATGAPAVTVDLYADNDAARRLYLRLGFSTAREFCSWSLPGR